MKTTLQNLHPSRRAPLAAVKRALKRIENPPVPPLKKEGKGEFNIFLTDDREISKLHWQFLRDRRPTDVMSFQCGNGGEVVISMDTAVRQARQRRIPIRWELTLLAVHGILHLSGMRDHKLSDWKKMRVAEFETMIRIL